MKYMSEDNVRRKAEEITGCDFGQNTTFKQIGLDDNSHEINNISNFLKEEYQIKDINKIKPDGWYIPKNINEPAIIFELKASNTKLDNEKIVKQIKKYMLIMATKYNKVIGILYNGLDKKIFKYSKGDIFEHDDGTNDLQQKNFYLSNIYKNKPIDKQKIYDCTANINNIFYKKIKISNMVDRMIFTACFLVAKQVGAIFYIDENENIDNLSTWQRIVVSYLKKRIKEDEGKNKNVNSKVNKLIYYFEKIECKKEKNDNKNINKFLREFIENLNDISDELNSPEWNGEDVLSIFFNEFSRYRKGNEDGQVFTPDHITQLMYEIANCGPNDNILDACCGSGAFLTKAMSMMINQVGGWHTKEAEDIKTNHLFGIENDEKIFSLACANMLLHRDGKTNLRLLDSSSEEAAEWIKSLNINKVLMNPPYEDDFKCLEIVLNVLDNVSASADCLFLLPCNKLRVNKHNKTKHILNKHTLYKIIKLPDIFSGVAGPGDVGIFWFKAKIPHKFNKIDCFWIKDDGYTNEQNKGRQDSFGLWTKENSKGLSLQKYWVESIKVNKDEFFNSKITIDPFLNEIEYIPEVNFEFNNSDFIKTVIDRFMFENPSLAKLFNINTQKELIDPLTLKFLQS